MDALNCPICFEIFSSPHQTECSHTFCLYCILQNINNGDRNCPICRMQVHALFPSLQLEALAEQERQKSNQCATLKPEMTNTCDEQKRIGNEHYNTGHIPKAIRCYSMAIENSDSYDSKAVYYSNRAACFDKLEIWNLALKDADSALNIRPTYEKALLRKAKCLEKLHRKKEAKQIYRDLKYESSGLESLIRDAKPMHDANMEWARTTCLPDSRNKDDCVIQ